MCREACGEVRVDVGGKMWGVGEGVRGGLGGVGGGAEEASGSRVRQGGDLLILPAGDGLLEGLYLLHRGDSLRLLALEFR